MLEQTRGNLSNYIPKDFTESILNPSADFGGLYAPKTLPILSQEALKKFAHLPYIELAKEIFKVLHIALDEDILQKALQQYEKFDNPNNPAPLIQLHDNFYIQELYHGPTRAFKDMALQPLAPIFAHLAQQQKEKYLILVATSGDTGPATLHSFADKNNIFVVCLYPKGGTSDVQRLQMTTMNNKNLKVIGIEGNFDDAQSALKECLNSATFKQELYNNNILLSAANSVNFGRIVFQIIYHAYAALQFNEGVDIIVPSGNFGNALGGFYAKLMGFNIGKIIVASNINNVLTEWINTGTYNIREKILHQTQSPAMDILKSSNTERVLYALYGAQRTKDLQMHLDTQGYYYLTKEELLMLQKHFSAIECTDQQGAELIFKYAQKGYLFDPHTATAIRAYEYFKNSSKRMKVVLSTAEWTKFAPSVASALGGENLNDKQGLHFISQKMNKVIPQSIAELFNKQEVHLATVKKTEITKTILEWITSITNQ